jgi:hypothetical protein
MEEAKAIQNFWTDAATQDLKDFVESCIVSGGMKYRVNDEDDVFYILDFENDFHIMGSTKENISMFSVGMPEEFPVDRIAWIRSNLIASGSLSAAVCV